MVASPSLVVSLQFLFRPSCDFHPSVFFLKSSLSVVYSRNISLYLFRHADDSLTHHHKVVRLHRPAFHLPRLRQLIFALYQSQGLYESMLIFSHSISLEVSAKISSISSNLACTSLTKSLSDSLLDT